MKKSRMDWAKGMGCLVVLGLVGAACMAVTAMNKPVDQEMTRLPGMSRVPRVATPSPALLVLNKNENTLAIVDPMTFAVIAKMPTGPIPHEVAASLDGKWAVTTNYGAHQDGTTLSVIDLVGQT